MKSPRFLAACWAVSAIYPVQAASDTAALSSNGSWGVLFQGLLGLLLVLAVMAGFFWFLRRFSPGQTGVQGTVKVVGGVMVGPRERVVVVEIGETWLLVGVGGGQVSPLHHMPKPASFEMPPADSTPGFAEKLRDFLPKNSGFRPSP